MKSKETFLIALNIFLLFVIVFGGRGLDVAKANGKSDQTLFDSLKTFTDVLAIVERDYVREADSQKMISGAIKGMLATLDPHSGYLEPEFYKDLQVQTKGEFGGLGLEVTIKDGMLLVVAPMEGSPAARAGILAGDVIVKIEGKFTKEVSLVDAVKKLRGPKGTKIRLAISRKGRSELLNFTLVRDNITVKSVRGRNLGDGIAWVRISQFVERTADDLQKELKQLNTKSQPIRGLILDLRNNPGGLLSQAVKVSDFFLKEGLVVYTQGRSGKNDQKYYAHTRGQEPSYPIVVLVNGGSASAAEIVAGALKEHGRAILVGKKTFGKGSVQTVSALDNGGALTLTTALYYLKSGESIQATGVTPDVIVAAAVFEDDAHNKKSFDDFTHESELPGAFENPATEDDDSIGGLTAEAPVVGKDCLNLDFQKEKIANLSTCDPQFAKAYEIVKGFEVFTVSGS